MLAGLPLLLSDTPAQREMAAHLGEAARLVRLEDVDAMAAALDDLVADPARLKRARTRAWELAQRRYNWDVEKDKFLSAVERALN